MSEGEHTVVSACDLTNIKHKLLASFSISSTVCTKQESLQIVTQRKKGRGKTVCGVVSPAKMALLCFLIGLEIWNQMT